MREQGGVATMVVAASLFLGGSEASASRCSCPSDSLEGLRTVVEFQSGLEIPESVTTDSQGNLYISVGNTIRRRASNGDLQVYATLPAEIFALGLKVGPDGCVYSASTSLSAVPGAFVWRACSAGSVEVFAELDPSGGPNDLAFDDTGNLLVTDPVLGRVWRIDPGGNPQVWLQHPLLAGDPSNPALLFRALGVNGIAFDRKDRFVYFSNTDQGTILRVSLRSETRSPSVFLQDERLRGSDGIAFDRGGTLFVAVNGLDAVVSVSHQRELCVLGQGGLLDAPSSFVFGGTHADRHRLYLVNSAFSRTLGLVPGVPRPALLSFSKLQPLRYSKPGHR